MSTGVARFCRMRATRFRTINTLPHMPANVAAVVYSDIGSPRAPPRPRLPMSRHPDFKQLWPQLSGDEKPICRRVIGNTVQNGTSALDFVLVDYST